MIGATRRFIGVKVGGSATTYYSDYCAANTSFVFVSTYGGSSSFVNSSIASKQWLGIFIRNIRVTEMGSDRGSSDSRTITIRVASWFIVG